MTQTEKAIHEVKETIAAHVQILAGIRKDTDNIGKEADKSNDAIDKLRNRISDLQAQVAVLSADFEDFKKRWDESNRIAGAGPFMKSCLPPP